MIHNFSSVNEVLVAKKGVPAACVMCEYVMREIEHQLNDKATEVSWTEVVF